MFESNEALIANLVEEGVLKTPRIIEAFRAIDRKDFVPPELQDDAYVNAPLPIGFGQTISQPLTVAFMLELLQPQPGEKILDIGSGSGWQTALLGHIVSQPHRPVIASPIESPSDLYGASEVAVATEEQTIVITPPVIARSEPEPREGERRSNLEAAGRVFAIERIPELCTFAKQNIAKYNFISRGVVEFFCQDGSLGLPEHAPFDKIIAAASAQELPPVWREQLKIGCRIVTPIQNSVWLFEKIADDKWRETEYPGFAFVPLVAGS